MGPRQVIYTKLKVFERAFWANNPESSETLMKGSKLTNTPLNLDHSKSEFFIFFIFLPHTKLIIIYQFCKIQSGHSYSSPAMIFLILTETYNACDCVKLVLKLKKFIV